MQPTKATIQAFKQAEHQLIQSPDFSAQAWQNLWRQYKGDFATAKVVKSKVQHDLWNVLTPEQQTKAQTRGKKKKSKHPK